MLIKPSQEQPGYKGAEIPHDLLEVPDTITHSVYNDAHYMTRTLNQRNLDSDEAEPQKDSKEDVFFIEMCILVSSSYAAHFKTLENVQTYVGVLLTLVNIIYLQIQSPRIQVRICAIKHLSTSDEAEINDQIRHNGEIYIEASSTLANLKEYVADNTAFSKYDLVFLLTSKQLLSTKRDETLETNIRGKYTGNHRTSNEYDVPRLCSSSCQLLNSTLERLLYLGQSSANIHSLAPIFTPSS